MSEGYLPPLEDEAGTSGRPAAEGLFDPALERDACGVGFIANLKGLKSHGIVENALKFLRTSSIAALSVPTLCPATVPAF